MIKSMKSTFLPMHVCLVMLLLLFPVFSRAQIVFEKGFEISGGAGLDGKTRYAAGASFVGALRFNPFLSIGAGVGYQHALALTSKETVVGSGLNNKYEHADRLKLFGRVKGNFTRNRISPFAAVDAGAAVKLSKSSLNPVSGFFAEPALGCDFGLQGRQKLAVFVGYQLQNTHYLASLTSEGKVMDVVDKQDFAGILTLHLGFYF